MPRVDLDMDASRRNIPRMSKPKTAHAPEGGDALQCPIPLCEHVFTRGLTGWHGHVGKVANHPMWHPRVEDSEERVRLFNKEYPTFWADARTPSRRRGQVPSAPPRRTPSVPPPASSATPTMNAAFDTQRPGPAQPSIHFCPNCGTDLSAFVASAVTPRAAGRR